MPTLPPLITVNTSVVPSRKFKISPDPSCLTSKAVPDDEALSDSIETTELSVVPV